MRRVCRPGGRIVILNHFKSQNPWLAKFDTAISPLTVHIGFKTDLDLNAFLTQASLTPVSIEKVNLLHMWTLVTCIKYEGPAIPVQRLRRTVARARGRIRLGTIRGVS